MSFITWVAVLGAVLLTLALTSSYLRWMPVTTSAVCLVLDVLAETIQGTGRTSGPGGGPEHSGPRHQHPANAGPL
jgi:hypothetical protein